MTNPLRRKQIAKAYLEALDMAGGYALEDTRLMGFVGDLVRPEPSGEEHAAVKTLLKDGNYIRRAPENPMDKELVEWVITDLGRNYLASL